MIVADPAAIPTVYWGPPDPRWSTNHYERAPSSSTLLTPHWPPDQMPLSLHACGEGMTWVWPSVDKFSHKSQYIYIYCIYIYILYILYIYNKPISRWNVSLLKVICCRNCSPMTFLWPKAWWCGFTRNWLEGWDQQNPQIHAESGGYVSFPFFPGKKVGVERRWNKQIHKRYKRYCRFFLVLSGVR